MTSIVLPPVQQASPMIIMITSSSSSSRFYPNTAAFQHQHHPLFHASLTTTHNVPNHHNDTNDMAAGSAAAMALLLLQQRQQQQQQQRLMNTSEPKKRPRKQVQFANRVQIIIASMDEHDEELKKNNWYSCADLVNFREEAREACRQLKFVLVQNNHHHQDMAAAAISDDSDSCETTTTKSAPTMAYNTVTRGLESRLCAERSRRRYLAKRCVVRAQSKLTPERLADLSQRCSHWAARLAHEEAARDFQRAYYHRHNINNINDNDDHEIYFATNTTTPQPNTTKRPVSPCSSEEEESRRVRPRI